MRTAYMYAPLCPATRTGHHQNGAVLVIALIMLLAMTLIGVTGLSSTTMQERMAGNLREMDIAFQAAEAALREGETFLESATLPDFDGTGGLYQPAASGSPQVWDAISWANASASKEYTGAIADLAAQPRYIIEELAPVPAPGGSLSADAPAPETGMYRITAHAVGRSDSTVVTLQTTYKR